MATPIERIIMFARSVLDAEPTEQQLRAIADAYASRAPADEIMEAFGKPYEELSDDEKSLVLLEMLRREARAHLRYAAEQKASAELSAMVRQAGDAAEALF